MKTMNQAKRQLIACAVVALAAACSSGPAPAPAPVTEPAATPAPVVVGGDRDEHGCIASAGYQWCASISACARPWELAGERGFENTAEAYASFCAAQAAPKK